MTISKNKALVPIKKSVTIVARPVAFTDKLYKCVIPEGLTLYELLKNIDDRYVVCVDGEPVERNKWKGFVLYYGMSVTISDIPRSDEAAATIARIAVIAATAAILGPLGAGLSGFAATLFQAGTYALGSYLAFQMIPPDTIDEREEIKGNRRRSITGVRNQISPYSPIPVLYGKRRYYPPLAAYYFTEVAGTEQYVHVLLCLGYGPMSIGGFIVDSANTITEQTGLPPGTIKIGDNNIEVFQDFKYTIGTYQNIPHYNSIYEENPNIQLRLASSSGEDVWFPDGDSGTRTTQQGADQISIDITFPAGLWTQDPDGDIRYNNIVKFKVEFAPTGSNNWMVVDNNWQLRGFYKDTVSFSKTWDTVKDANGNNWPHQDSNKQYDVRVTRVESYVPERSPAVMDAVWTALRTIDVDTPRWVDPNNEKILMSLRIKVTDGMPSIIDRISIEAQSVLDVYDGVNWSKQATSNPAWCYYNALTGPQVRDPVPQSQIDINALKDWADWCTANNIEYNFVHDAKETVLQRIRTIAATGHAAWTIVDSKFSVVRDLTSGTEVQVISPRNSRNFVAEKVFRELPHGIKVHYVDRNVWEEDVVVIYRSGYNSSNATKFDELFPKGITDQQQAWFYGQYYFRQLILRPEVYRVTMDYENLVATRGDLVRLAYDTIKVGLQWARIKQVNGTTQIVVDEEIVVGSGTYAIRVRKSDGTTAVSNITNTAGTYTTLNLATAISGMNAGDLVLFGVAGSESILCKVTRIEYASNLEATVTMVDAALDIYNFGSPPVYNPNITNPPDLSEIPPPKPTIVNIESGTKALYRDTDGNVRASIMIGFTFSSSNLTPVDVVEARYRETGSSGAWYTVQTTAIDSSSIRLREQVNTGATYDIQLRARSPFGAWSDYTTVVSHTVLGKDQPPSDVTNFVAAQNGDVAVFTWDAVRDPDLSGYEIRYGPKGKTTWEDATPLTIVTKGTQITTANLPTGSWTVFIKAVDTAVPKQYSVNAAQDDLDFVSVFNIIEALSEQPVWRGTRKNFIKHFKGVLVPDSQIPADSTYTSETFTDNDGTWIGLHPQSGATWTSQQSGAPESASGQIWNNRLVGIARELNAYDKNANILSADYTVTATFYVASKQGNIGVAVRHSPTSEQYYGLIVDGSNLYIVKNGAYQNSDVLGSTAFAMSVGGSYTLSFQITGNLLEVWQGTIEDKPTATILLSVTDTDLQQEDYPAVVKVAYPGSGVSIPAGTADTATTGIHIDSFYCVYDDGWGVFDKFVLEPYPTCEYELPRNLVDNGNANRGDNTNFSQFVYDGTTGATNPGSFSVTSNNGVYTSDGFIEVETSRNYYCSAYFKTGNASTQIYAGVACYDKNKNVITFEGSWRDTNKNTTLYAATDVLSNTVDIVPPPQDWFDPTVSPYSYIQFNIRDDGSDLPQKAIKITTIDKTNDPTFWRLTLASPPPYRYPAGTPVGNSTSGSNYNYILASNIAPGTTFTQRTGTITGENGITEPPPTSKFRRGTKYVRFLLLPNRNGTDTTWVDDVGFILNGEQEIDNGFDDSLRFTIDIDSALGPGETGVANPKGFVDHRLELTDYDGYREWRTGILNGRFFRSKLVLDPSVGVAYIKTMNITLDNKERTESASNLSVGTGGLNITFSKPFHNVPFVKTSVVTNNPYFAVADNVTTTGFTLRVFDATTGNAVSVTNAAGYEATGV